MPNPIITRPSGAAELSLSTAGGPNVTTGQKWRPRMSNLLTVTVTKTANKAVSPDLIQANERVRKQLAESRPFMHVIAL